jgi:general secretion pathway protein J
MKRSSGFTLLEVMVAIVLTSVVALMAFGAARVSVEARSRLEADLRAAQGTRAMRELLRGALRNTVAPRLPGDTAFVLRDGRLTFVAAGVGPPFDAEYDWRITIAPDSGGLVLSAAAVGQLPAAPVAFRLPGVSGWDVQALPLGGKAWVREWTTPAVVPLAVSVTFLGDAPRPMPLRVALGRGGASVVSVDESEAMYQ